MSSMLLDSLDNPEERTELETRLATLGLDICLEWAKSNMVRKIDSAAVATWGTALRKAAERDEQWNFVRIVEDDVNALLNGTLSLDLIEEERYYPVEEYDDF